MLSVKKILELGPVIPVVVIDEVTNALALVDALLEGGIKVIEVTLRTEAALLVMEKILSISLQLFNLKFNSIFK